MLPDKIEADQSRRNALAAAMTALQPISALLLEAGVSFPDMMRLVRRAYVDEAAARQRATGSRPTISRIAASTGMSRPDVSEALTTPPIPSTANDLSPRAGDRILAGWKSDPDFLLLDGTPRPLSYLDSSPNFSDLVKRHGPDIPPRAMLKELLGSGHLDEISDDKFLPSKSSSFVSETRNEGIQNFGPKMNALGSTLMRNILGDAEDNLFEALSGLSSVSPESAPRIARELARRCKTFSQAIDRYLIDQQQLEPISNAVHQHSIGVIVAVIERTPEKDLPKRKRIKK